MTKTEMFQGSGGLFYEIEEGTGFASFYLLIQEQAPIIYSEASLDQISRAFTEADHHQMTAIGKLAWILHSEAELVVEDFDSSDNPIYSCEDKIAAIFEEAREIIGHTNF